MSPSTGLTSVEQLAWRGFLRAHATVLRALEADLQAEHELPLASYDVLVQLSESPDRRLRMTELADRVLLSRSGLTRLADRLEREGLLTREPCPSDARGTLAVLTDAGWDKVVATAPGHVSEVRRLVFDPLTKTQVRQLHDIATRIGVVVQPEGCLPTLPAPVAP